MTDYKRAQDRAIMTIMAIYYPVGYAHTHEVWDDDLQKYRQSDVGQDVIETDGQIPVFGDVDSYHYNKEHALNECFMFTSGDKAPIIVKPVIAFTIESISCFSFDSLCSMDYEWDNLGGNLFDGEWETLRKILMPHFENHPDMLEMYPGTTTPKPGRKHLPLSECKEPLVVTVPILWGLWFSEDSYTGEVSAETWIEGELDLFGSRVYPLDAPRYGTIEVELE